MSDYTKENEWLFKTIGDTIILATDVELELFRNQMYDMFSRTNIAMSDYEWMVEETIGAAVSVVVELLGRSVNEGVAAILSKVHALVSAAVTMSIDTAQHTELHQICQESSIALYMIMSRRLPHVYKGSEFFLKKIGPDYVVVCQVNLN
jgi:hypothetical protein